VLPWAHLSASPKWHLDRFSCFCTACGRVSLYFTMGRPFSPQNCPFAWGIWTPYNTWSNTWFLGPTEVHNPNGILISSAILQVSRSRQTDRPTNRPCCCVCNNRPHLCSTVMLPNNSTCNIKIFTIGSHQENSSIKRKTMNVTMCVDVNLYFIASNLICNLVFLHVRNVNNFSLLVLLAQLVTISTSCLSLYFINSRKHFFCVCC